MFTSVRMVALSVLDLSPVTTATPPAAALNNSLDLARFADRLGYTRYWLAEHHNLPTIASSAPDIMIGQVAAITKNMRIGSGGVMLPNHAPLMVMERFKVLEALFPGRIDLGLGRAPGTDQITSLALRRRQDTEQRAGRFPRPLPGDDAVREQRLSGQPSVLEGRRDADRRAAAADLAARARAAIRRELAAQVGAGFSFAHHFSDLPPEVPMLNYRNQFKPSAWRQTPYAILGVAAICADTEAEADRMATSADLHFARRASRANTARSQAPRKPPPIRTRRSTAQRIEHNRKRLIVGSPSQVHERIAALAESTKADEVMITTMVFDHAARKHSYALLADAFGLAVTVPQAAE